MARIFEPYVTTKPRGTGLGLAIVKKIVDEHHGSIAIENRAEPRRVGERAAAARAGGIAMAQILVVDDEVGIRELLSEILADEGHQVLLAENAGGARRLREAQRPDLVLLDIWMPDTDGITLLKEWAASGQLTMPVVMMSGHGTIETAVEATRIGALDFLEKPIALQRLLATVKRALRNPEAAAPPPLALAALGRSTGARRCQEAAGAARAVERAAAAARRARHAAGAVRAPARRAGRAVHRRRRAARRAARRISSRAPPAASCSCRT